MWSWITLEWPRERCVTPIVLRRHVRPTVDNIFIAKGALFDFIKEQCDCCGYGEWWLMGNLVPVVSGKLDLEGSKCRNVLDKKIREGTKDR